MSPLHTPAAIQAFFDTTNAGDSEGFVAAFAGDAFLDDWGREFHGHAGIGLWNQTDNIGKDTRLEVHDVRQGSRDGEYVATVTVTGRGYRGPGVFTFQVTDGLISRFIIA